MAVDTRLEVSSPGTWLNQGSSGGSMSALPLAAASSALSFAGDMIGQRQSYKYSRKLRQTAYQDTVSSMRAAGLNPILAAKQGATPATAVPMSQLGSAAVKAATSAAERSLLANQAKLLHEQARSLQYSNDVTEASLPGDIRKGKIYSEQEDWLPMLDLLVERLGPILGDVESIKRLLKKGPTGRR